MTVSNANGQQERENHFGHRPRNQCHGLWCAAHCGAKGRDVVDERVTGIIDAYLPDELAIEAPFFGKNVQSMLKLGRAQGVAIAAAICRDIPIHEYAPLKIKMAITGQGQASKAQVADMLQRLLRLDQGEMPKFMDATDALAAAYCHFLQQGNPTTTARHYNSWKDFVAKNQNVVRTMQQAKREG